MNPIEATVAPIKTDAKMTATIERTPIPAALEAKMKLWREGLIPLPPEYVEHHLAMARAALPKLETDYRILMTAVVDDGWGDGMKFLAATVEHKITHRLSVIKWSDNCRWYERCPGGGWGLFR